MQGECTHHRILIILLLAPFLSYGCATYPDDPDSAPHVPEDRLIDQSLTSGAPVTVIRSSAFSGSGCPSQFQIDGSPVALIDPGEKVDFRLEPGNYAFSAQPTGFCGGSGNATRAEIREGKRNIYKVHSGFGTSIGEWGK